MGLKASCGWGGQGELAAQLSAPSPAQAQTHIHSVWVSSLLAPLWPLPLPPFAHGVLWDQLLLSSPSPGFHPWVQNDPGHGGVAKSYLCLGTPVKRRCQRNVLPDTLKARERKTARREGKPSGTQTLPPAAPGCAQKPRSGPHCRPGLLAPSQ